MPIDGWDALVDLSGSSACTQGSSDGLVSWVTKLELVLDLATFTTKSSTASCFLLFLSNGILTGGTDDIGFLMTNKSYFFCKNGGRRKAAPSSLTSIKATKWSFFAGNVMVEM